MENESWREAVLAKLTVLLRRNKDVLSLSLYGSLANSKVEKDKWSDIDALLVVEDSALDTFYPTMEWLKPLGEIFAYQQVDYCTKVIFADFRKIDINIRTRSQIAESQAFWTKQRFIFSNDEEVKRILEERFKTYYPPSVGSYNFPQLVEEYWYISFVAVTKLIRNDLLTSFHLTLELYKKCLELVMWLRDKEVGTNIHRTGGVRNDFLEKMTIQFQGLTKKDILNLIEKSGKEFDTLALKWSPEYTAHLPIFEKVLASARNDINDN